MINKSLKNRFFISTMILFLIGSLLHFTYELLGNNFFVGLITPVNESVWEHLKLATLPIFLWWLIVYLNEKKKHDLDKGKWFLGCLVSLIVSNSIILGVYYFVRYGLDIESIIMDVILLYIAILFGQIAGYHIYNYSKTRKFYFSVLMIAILMFSFMILTINSPKIPLFKDVKTHTYGIYKK